MLPEFLAEVLTTHELDQRPSRPPDLLGENEALRALMATAAHRPDEIFQRLVETAMALCGAESAGLSVEDHDPQEGPVYRWWATAGLLSPLQSASLPRDGSPCGIVVERGLSQTMAWPERAYPAVRAVNPPVSAVLLAPFRQEGKTIGTVWVANHSGGRPFEAEDRRLLESLAGFAELAWRAHSERVAENLAAARYQRLFESIGEGFCVVTMEFDANGKAVDYRFRGFNPMFTELTGIPAEWARNGVSAREAVPDLEEFWFETYGRVARTGEPVRFENRAEAMGKWFEVHAFRLGGEGSNEVGILFKNINERRHAAHAAEEERARLTQLLHRAPAAVALLEGPELRFTFVNDEYRKLVGHRDVVGLTIHEALPDIRGQGYYELLERVLATGESFSGTELPVLLQNAPDAEPETHYVTLLYQAMRDAEGVPYGVFVHALDVTAQVLARSEIAEREERFRVAQETNPNPFTIVDAVRDESGRIIDFRWSYVNSAATQLTGDSIADLVGKSLLERRPAMKHGTLFEAHVRAVETGEPFVYELPLTYQGRSIFARLTGVRVGDGVAATLIDLTDRYEAEERLQEAVAARTAELQQAVREAEAFNYAIAHDLRTPLRHIVATSRILLEESAALPADQQELLKRQAYNATRLGTLIDELLRLSRLSRAVVHREPLDLTAEARSVVRELETPCEITVQEGMSAEADPRLLRTVLHNLIGNACKFSPSAKGVQVGETNGVYWVKDEGVGFDMKYVEKIFLPFERLVPEDAFPGTGIGLANVDRIVKRHGGRVWAESEPNKGATFYFTLGG